MRPPPSDFMDQAARRLGRGALVLCVFFLGIAVLTLGTPWFLGAERHTTLATTADLALAALCGLTALSILRGAVSTTTALRLGVILEVVGALLLSVFIYMTPLNEAAGPDGLSGVSIWVLIMPFLVPVRPRRRVLLSMGAASMPLLVVGVLDPLFGFGTPSWNLLLQIALPNWLSGILGLAVAAQITSWGSQIAAARHEAEQLGSYQLVTLLGRGGMGEVWLARHRMLARPAAVKFVRHRRVGDRAVLERFAREARATAQLSSPHTVRVYDYGVDEQHDEFFYVMEMLDGLDLETFVDRYGTLPPARAIHVMLQVCKSLAEAHDHDLIHRDIKPANIYLCRLGGEHDMVKVLDFGLVLETGERSSDDEHRGRLTEQGMVTGTPGFMAPEAARGLNDIDHRLDVYAFGCVLFWMLTGTTVVEEAGRTAMDVLIAHIKDPPRRASEYTDAAIPPELDRLILDCVAKDRDARPPGMRTVAARLRGIPGPMWSVEDAADWWEAHQPATQATIGRIGRHPS